MEVNGVGGPIEKVTQPTLQTSPTLVYNTHNASEDLEQKDLQCAGCRIGTGVTPCLNWELTVLKLYYF